MTHHIFHGTIVAVKESDQSDFRSLNFESIHFRQAGYNEEDAGITTQFTTTLYMNHVSDAECKTSTNRSIILLSLSVDC